jgi:hypothetical protein
MATELDFEQIMNFRLSDQINPEENINGIIDWGEVLGLLETQFKTICCETERFSDINTKQRIKEYLLENGFTLETIRILHSDFIEEDIELMFENIISWYKRLLAFSY